MRSVGVHLLQSRDLVDTPRPSAIVELDGTGSLADLRLAGPLEEVAAGIGDPPALVAVDAPLVVRNAVGRRRVEEVLAWCDIPAFPASRERLGKVFGGLRGEELRDAAPGGLDLAETLPDLALRLMMWEESTGGEALDPKDYRERWVGVRPPVYRPKGPGRARPSGLAAAHALVSRHVDLAGWDLATDPDDWQAIRDAAVLDAIACAWVAHRAARSPEAAMRIVTEDGGALLLPVDVNLRTRLEATLARLGPGAPPAV